MILRITDLNGLFIRDDFTFDPDTEIGLDVAPAQGFYSPKWDGKQWVEGRTQAEIDAIKAQAPQAESTPITLLTTEITALKARLAKVESTDTVKAEMVAIAEPIIKPITKG